MIIGSTAIKHYFSEFNRIPKDVDIIKQDSFLFQTDLKVELLDNPVLINYYKKAGFIPKYIYPDDLYTLKISHTAGWNINWEKHVWDIQFLKERGCKLNTGLLEELYEFWVQIHGKPKKSDLSLKTEDFFDNAVNYPIEHDKIHEIINPNPSYLKIKKDNLSAQTHKELWDNLIDTDKLDIIREETMVMAAERFASLGYKRAYHKMLKKLIINHLPYYQSVFAVQNHKELSKCNINFIQKINESVL